MTQSKPQTQPTQSHTPGPWKVSKRDAATIEAVAPGLSGYTICTMDFGCGRGVLSPEAAANARLIAAAPELLEALKAVRHIVDADAARIMATIDGKSEEAEGHSEGALVYIQQLDAAIASATKA